MADSASRIREFFRRDKEQLALRMAKGTSPSGPASAGYDMLQAYGQDVLSDYLRLEQDLMSRFTDYEEMDDYGEIACVSADLRVPVVNVPRDFVSFCPEDTTMGMTAINSKTVGELFRDFEEGKTDGPFVYAFDHAAGRIVVAKAIGPKLSGKKVPVYRVTYEDYRRARQWSLKCTGNHPFMLRDGSYREARLLQPDDRLMPCTLRTEVSGYLTMYQPTLKTKSGHCVWTPIHRLVMAAMLEHSLGDNDIVHHKDRNKGNARPSNLELTTLGAHLREHINNPIDEQKRIAAISAGLRKKWSDPAFKLRVAQQQSSKKPEWLSTENAGGHKHFVAKGILSQEHRAAIAKGHTLDRAPDAIEAALRGSASVNEAAAKLNVSWNTLVRRMDRLRLGREILGSNLGGPKIGEVGYENHRVVSVELCGEEDVYDLEVPGYHNFAVGDPSGEGGFVFTHNTALDVYSDDSSQPETQLNRTVWIESQDESVQRVLDDLMHKTLRIDEEIWEIARSLCKYGNVCEELLVTSNGVEGLNHLPAPTVRRIEGPRGELYGFIQDFRGKFGYGPQEFQQILTQRMASPSGRAGFPDNSKTSSSNGRTVALEDWEVAHFRLRGKYRRSIYGHSVLESARWIWKRLMMMEDAAMIFRLQRAPERFAFYVDVGDLPPAEAHAFVNRVRQGHKKTKYFNPTCLTADTCITCLDGVDRSIGELARNYADKSFWVFSYDLKSGKIVPGKATAPRKTGEKAPVWRVVLDNGAVVRSTGNHPFLMRDGSYKAANRLKMGDSLMPLYMSRGSTGTSGYWMCEDPATGTRKPVHRLIAEAVYGEGAVYGLDIHHRDENKSNNTPENLEPLTKSEHLKRHPENVLRAGNAFAARLRTDAVFAKEVASRLDGHRDPAAAGRQSQALRGVEAADGQKRLMELIASEVVRDPLVVVEDLLERLNKNPEFQAVYAGLPTTQRSEMSVGCFHAFVRRQGFEGFKDFKTKQCGAARWRNRTYGGVPTTERQVSNHKVLSVVFDGYEDVYNLDVETYHNFALTAGVFTHNSGKLDLKFNPIGSDEDFFVGTRKGQDGTRIEVLGAPAWQSVEDVSYFRDKLFAALKVPKAYMGQEEGVARAVLSSEDVRFARTVLRVQRELRNGLAKICRIHLAALNIDPYAVDYDIRMTVPSSIFELAQLEVRTARADLAGRMGQFVSLHWTLSNVFGFTDHDIEKIIGEQEDDAVRLAVNQVRAELAAQKFQQENAPAQPMAAPDTGAPPVQAPGSEGGAPGQEQTPPDGTQPAEDTTSAPSQPAPPSGTASRMKSLTAYRNKKYPLTQGRPRYGRGGITEKELFEGANREKEKRASDKLEVLLKNDKALARRLLEIRSMLDEVRSVRSGR